MKIFVFRQIPALELGIWENYVDMTTLQYHRLALNVMESSKRSIANFDEYSIGSKMVQLVQSR